MGKTKKTIAKRIRITRRGKVLRRAMGQGHGLAKQRRVRIHRKRRARTLYGHAQAIAMMRRDS